MADHGGNGGTGEVVDRLEGRGEPMAVEQEDPQPVEAIANTGAVVEGGGNGAQGQKQDVGDGEKDRALEENPRARVLSGAEGSISEAESSGAVAEGPPIVGGGSGDGGSSGAVGDVPGPNGSPPRDPAKGKSVVITEEERPTGEEQTTEAPPIEIREKDIASRPPVTAATSLRHIPITYDDIIEHTPDEMLARLLEDRPDIGEIVLKAKEDRARAIEAAEATERAERERKDREEPLRDMEAEERAAEETLGPRVTTVAEVAAARWPDYTAEPYTPPVPHLFVPLGFSVYTPQRSEYDDEIMLRDHLIHIANTWVEVIPENPLCTSISNLLTCLVDC
ncbi:hypothetical protein RHMOL_Rhmol01G0188600 [Rhododendron molle]|uniref:Uncharacterized protein n=1 Tax=Rhododendron molle TaxID=49168 RepID=A0ACC0Q4Y0_RHOML|nr:hypothetical protein RHMOL_Rhmol01G0188600 [Rhododendron molle]